jgi:uncharacterized membrane protein YesL
MFTFLKEFLKECGCFYGIPVTTYYFISFDFHSVPESEQNHHTHSFLDILLLCITFVYYSAFVYYLSYI